MNPAPLAAVAATGLTIAFLHAALPTHWLPFVLVGRAQGWRPAKVLAVTGLAGVGHVLFTAALGALLTGAGLALLPHLGVVFPRAVGLTLGAIGLYYILRQATGRGGHSHGGPAHSHGDAAARLGGRPDRAAILGLVAILTLSPCEAFLPIYLANVRYGWGGFAVLSLVLVAGVALAMMLFTSLCLAGADRLRLERLERYEAGIIGAVLCILGVFVALEG